MKLLQLLLSPRIGGAESLAASLAEEWQSRGYSCTLNYVDPDDDCATGPWARLLRTRRLLLRERPDVVISHSVIPNVYARLAALRTMRIVTVLHSAGDDYKSFRFNLMERLLASRTEHVIAVSRAQANDYEKHFGSAIPLTVIPNGIPCQGFVPRSYDRPPRNVLTVARISSQKNPGLWVKVARAAAAEGLALSFKWVGPLEEDPAIAGLVDEAKGDGNIVFVGPRGNVTKLLAEADFMFHPSDREGHSLALLEAAQAGLPIVCSREANTGNFPLAVEAFDAGDAEGALEAVRNLLRRWASLETEVSHRSAAIGKEFSISRTAGDYLRVLESPDVED